MGDTLNALQMMQQPRGGSLPGPVVANPLAAVTAGTQAASNVFDLRSKQADMAWGSALQQATDPQTGVVDYNAAARIAASMGPVAQMGMARNLQNASNIKSQQLEQSAFTTKLIGMQAMTVARNPSDANVNAAFDNLKASGLPSAQVESERARWLAMSQDERADNAVRVGMSQLDQLHQVIGQTTLQNTGGQFQPITITQPTARTPGGMTVGPGSAPLTASPDTVISLPDVVVKATQADVQAGLATAPGQEIRISGAEAKRRQDSGLLPPGSVLRTVPNTGGGGGGPGVVDNTGKPVGPTNPPRLLKVPGSDSTPPSAASPPAPAPLPPGVTAPPVPAGANTGIGVALKPSTAAPAPATALPVPPVPPATTPPAVSTPPTPTPALPPASGLKYNLNSQGAPGGTILGYLPNGKPVLAGPAETHVGITGWNSDGTPIRGASTPPPPSVNAPTDSMTPRPRAALQGGVPVASTNALLAPTVGPAAPPSPAVVGDVNALIQGMNQGRAARGAPGMQVATGGSGSFAVGPGYEEQANAAASAERLTADNQFTANYAANVFPQAQALSLYGRGIATGPGTDFQNAMKGWAGALFRNATGYAGPFDKTKDYDELHKWLSQIVTSNPYAAGSDARLAATLSGNANTGIHEQAAADMLKTGIALMRMRATADARWNAMSPDEKAQYGYYNDFLRQFNKDVDVRGFAIDMMNTEQKKTLLADIKAHGGAGSAYEKKIMDTRQQATDAGYMGSERAMP